MIILAGGTGDLGHRIAREVLKMRAPLRVLARDGTSRDKILALESLGCQVIVVDFSNQEGLSKACLGGSVVVSALSGLRDSMVVAQTQLLHAAISANVPRFIPSDFALDFTRIPDGWNRNLSFRREFMKIADSSNIRVTSILNGGFMDMLTGVAPFILFNAHRILCWGNPNQLTDWTTIEDTAKYTALAALDDQTPRFLRIAGDQVSANTLAFIMTELTGKKHKILRPGNLHMFRVLIHLARLFTKKTNDLYPAWQGMQYMHNMYSGKAKFESTDNERYPMNWTKAKDLLDQFLKSKV
ncbi:MAG: NmrA family NAD(P)-binding protein [Pseudomonadota bacterium]